MICLYFVISQNCKAQQTQNLFEIYESFIDMIQCYQVLVFFVMCTSKRTGIIAFDIADAEIY